MCLTYKLTQGSLKKRFLVNLKKKKYNSLVRSLYPYKDINHN